MQGTFEGKVALVTGGGSGIGRGTALAFAREGAKVVVADIAAEGGERTVQLIEEAGGKSLFVESDVARAGDVETLVVRTVDSFGALDCAFNNAGIGGPRVPIHEVSESEWDSVIAVNLTGVWLCMKHEIRQMLDQGSGAIVNASSIAGLKSTKGPAAYCATKHAVVGLTRTAALDYA